MYSSVVPVLYYSPSLINQISIFNDGGTVISSSESKKSSHSLSAKAIIDKLFIPIKAEGTFENGNSKEKQVTKEYSDLSRAIDVVKEAQKEALNSRLLSINDSIDTIAYVDGVFKLSTKKSSTDDSILILVEGKFGDYTIEGQTSVDNWASKSLINHLLLCGDVCASAIVFHLLIKEKKIQVKYVCIFLL